MQTFMTGCAFRPIVTEALHGLAGVATELQGGVFDTKVQAVNVLDHVTRVAFGQDIATAVELELAGLTASNDLLRAAEYSTNLARRIGRVINDVSETTCPPGCAETPRTSCPRLDMLMKSREQNLGPSPNA